MGCSGLFDLECFGFWGRYPGYLAFFTGARYGNLNFNIDERYP